MSKNVENQVAQTSLRKGWPVPGDHEILIATLGGIGEIGMNMTLYGHAGKWLIVDAGVAFMKPAEKEATGANSKSIAFNAIRQIADDIVGMVITHAHEDHIGAIQALWPQYMNCPIYATPFASKIIEMKTDADIVPFQVGSDLKIGPFDIETIEMTHSVPEPVSLVISGEHCPRRIFHSGDWKFDDAPIFGKYDMERLEEAGETGIDVILSDSTNSPKENVKFNSELDVGKALDAIMQDAPGMVLVCCFASNVDRLVNIAEKAQINNRSVAYAGRSMINFMTVAEEMGMLGGLENIVYDPLDLDSIPPENKVLVCTGVQGEEHAMLSRLSGGGLDNGKRLPHIPPGSTLVMSGRTIPGNEQFVDPILKRFRDNGVTVITSDQLVNDYPVHVSGHASGGEIRRLYKTLIGNNPERKVTVMPVHGEAHHLLANGKIANECGADCMYPLPGAVMSLNKNGNVRHVSTVNVPLFHHYDKPARHHNNNRYSQQRPKDPSPF